AAERLAALHARARGACIRQQVLMAAKTTLGDQRPELQGLHTPAEALQERALERGRDEHTVDGVAGLAGVHVALDGRDVYGELEIGVVEDDQRAVAPQLEADGLEARRGPAGDDPGDAA